MKKLITLLALFTLTACNTPAIPPVEEEPEEVVTPISYDVYLVDLEDNGANGPLIGCGDSLDSLNLTETTTMQPIEAAITALVTETAQTVGGLYNVFYQSNLTVNSATISGSTASIDLSGQLMLAGVCDNPRVEETIKATAMQFAGVTTVNVTLNGDTLANALSLQ